MKGYCWLFVLLLVLVGLTSNVSNVCCQESTLQTSNSHHSDHLNDVTDEFPNNYRPFVIPIEANKWITVSPIITCTSFENDTWRPNHSKCKSAQTILVDDDWNDKDANYTYIFEDWIDYDWNDIVVNLYAVISNGFSSELHLSFREATWKNPFSIEITPGGTWIELRWSSTDFPDLKSIIIKQGETAEIELFSESNLNDSASIEFLIPPVALFSWHPEKPIVGETITIDASESYDPDKSIETYSWTLSDGTSIDTPNKTITHIFLSAGSCIINLTVCDTDGLKNTITKKVDVLAIIGGKTTSLTYSPMNLWANANLLIITSVGVFAVLVRRRKQRLKTPE